MMKFFWPNTPAFSLSPQMSSEDAAPAPAIVPAPAPGVEVSSVEQEDEDTVPFSPAFQQAMELASQGRDVHTIDLYKPENSSLGFSVVGLKSEHRGELGIFVQELQPGGIAAR